MLQSKNFLLSKIGAKLQRPNVRHRRFLHNPLAPSALYTTLNIVIAKEKLHLFHFIFLVVCHHPHVSMSGNRLVVLDNLGHSFLSFFLAQSTPLRHRGGSFYHLKITFRVAFIELNIHPLGAKGVKIAMLKLRIFSTL